MLLQHKSITHALISTRQKIPSLTLPGTNCLVETEHGQGDDGHSSGETNLLGSAVDDDS